MLKIEKVAHAQDLKENFTLTEKLISDANDASNFYVDAYDFRFVKPEHDFEGIYQMEMEAVYPQRYMQAVNDLSYYLAGVWAKADIQFGVKSELPKFDFDSVAQRKTLDGKKLYKTVKNYIQKIRKLSTESFKEMNELFKSDGYVLADVFERMAKLNRLLEKSETALRKLEFLDQQGGYFQKVEDVKYVRVSFRSQDVAGMSALGDFTSCQDIRYHGWDEHSVGVLGSLLSQAIGTATLFDTLEDAKSRDDGNVWEQATHDARILIATDENGSIHLNDRIYYGSNEAQVTLKMFIEYMEENGKTLPYDEMGTIFLTSTSVCGMRYDSFEYYGDADFKVDFYSYDDDEILEIANEVLTNNEHCEFEHLDDAIEELEAQGLTDELKCELIAKVEVTGWDYTENYLYLTSVHDCDREFGLSDCEVNEYVGSYDLQEAIESQMEGLDIYDTISYMMDGEMTVCLNLEIRLEDMEDEIDYHCEPYLEGTLNRVSRCY